jgi:hypothetical protein
MNKKFQFDFFYIKPPEGYRWLKTNVDTLKHDDISWYSDIPDDFNATAIICRCNLLGKLFDIKNPKLWPHNYNYYKKDIIYGWIRKLSNEIV